MSDADWESGLGKMGRTAHAEVRSCADDRLMDDCGMFHRIEDDLSNDWVADWAQDGVQAIEQYLAKHLAFQTFLED
jgi:hypothetical protein